jgi:MFS family permease
LWYKKTIAIGIVAWAVRYYMLAGSVNAAALQTLLIFGAILLHGVCYDFLFIAGQLYVDSQANERIRGASQGFIAFILWGIGSFVGTMLAGKVLGTYAITSAAGVVTHNWQSIWMKPALGASAVLVIFLIFFREPQKTPQPAIVEEVAAVP